MRRNRRNQNQAGYIYLTFVGIALVVIVIIYLGVIKDPTAKLERKIEKVTINLENKI